jgi:hypothetical protein
MKQLHFYSITLHFATLCCFFLPFFYTGCGEEKTPETTRVDTTAASTRDSLLSSKPTPKDTTQKMTSSPEDSVPKFSASSKQDSAIKAANDNDDLSLKICLKLPFLRPFLVSKPDTYSGIALVINMSQYFIYYAIVFSVLLLLLSLLIKYIEPSARFSILLLEGISLICLFFSEANALESKELWGYWVAFSCLFVLAFLDGYILRLSIRQTNA